MPDVTGTPVPIIPDARDFHIRESHWEIVAEVSSIDRWTKEEAIHRPRRHGVGSHARCLRPAVHLSALRVIASRIKFLRCGSAPGTLALADEFPEEALELFHIGETLARLLVAKNNLLRAPTRRMTYLFEEL